MNTVEPIRDLDVVMDIAEYLKGKSDRNYVMFMFGIYTGLRISDILKFRVRDVRDKDAVYIREKKTGKVLTTVQCALTNIGIPIFVGVLSSLITTLLLSLF